MNQIIIQLAKNNIKERITTLLTSILNVVIITNFLMIIVELNKIQAEIEKVSRD